MSQVLKDTIDPHAEESQLYGIGNVAASEDSLSLSPRHKHNCSLLAYGFALRFMLLPSFFGDNKKKEPEVCEARRRVSGCSRAPRKSGGRKSWLGE